MKQNDFLSAVGGIDKDLLEPVAESRANDKKNPIRFVILVGAVAAAIVAVAAFSLALGTKGPTGTPVAPADGTESTEEQLPATEPIAIVSDDTGTDTEHQTEPATAPIATFEDNTDTPRQTETERQSDHVSVEGSMTTPDLSFTIYVSSEIVRGTVVAEGETRRSNPTGEGINGMGNVIPDGVISFYDFKVEEVFKGDVMVGDTIRVFTVAPITAPDLEVEDEFPYRLELGQAGIFCIDKDDIWTEPSEGVAYGIVESGRGVFDRVDGNGIYHSFVYDLNPADLPALIAAADEKWAPVFEHYADNPI